MLKHSFAAHSAVLPLTTLSASHWSVFPFDPTYHHYNRMLFYRIFISPFRKYFTLFLYLSGIRCKRFNLVVKKCLCDKTGFWLRASMLHRLRYDGAKNWENCKCKMITKRKKNQPKGIQANGIQEMLITIAGWRTEMKIITKSKCWKKNSFLYLCLVHWFTRKYLQNSPCAISHWFNNNEITFCCLRFNWIRAICCCDEDVWRLMQMRTKSNVWDDVEHVTMENCSMFRCYEYIVSTRPHKGSDLVSDISFRATKKMKKLINMSNLSVCFFLFFFHRRLFHSCFNCWQDITAINE